MMGNEVIPRKWKRTHESLWIGFSIGCQELQKQNHVEKHIKPWPINVFLEVSICTSDSWRDIFLQREHCLWWLGHRTLGLVGISFCVWVSKPTVIWWRKSQLDRALESHVDPMFQTYGQWVFNKDSFVLILNQFLSKSYVNLRIFGFTWQKGIYASLFFGWKLQQDFFHGLRSLSWSQKAAQV